MKGWKGTCTLQWLLIRLIKVVARKKVVSLRFIDFPYSTSTLYNISSLNFRREIILGWKPNEDLLINFLSMIKEKKREKKSRFFLLFFSSLDDITDGFSTQWWVKGKWGGNFEGIFHCECCNFVYLDEVMLRGLMRALKEKHLGCGGNFFSFGLRFL